MSRTKQSNNMRHIKRRKTKKRGMVWEVRIRQVGKEEFFNVYKTYEDARKVRDKVLSDWDQEDDAIKKGRLPDQSVSYCVEKFLQSRKLTGIGDGQYQRYVKMLHVFCETYGRKSINAINTIIINDFLIQFEKLGRKNVKWANETKKKQRGYIRTFLDWCFQNELKAEGLKKADHIETETTLPIPYTEEETQKIFKTVTGKTKLMFLLGIEMGLRLGEIVFLEKNKIFFNDNACKRSIIYRLQAAKTNEIISLI